MLKVIKNRKISALTALLLCLIFLVGCAAPDLKLKKHETVEKTAIKVSWWGNDERHEYTMDGLKEFTDNNPDINIKYSYCVWNGYDTRMQVMMESCTEADVMQINYPWLKKYSEDGDGYYDLYQLSDYIDLSQFSKEDLEFGIRNGKLNALPIALNTTEFYYNEDIWKGKYNLEYPESWEDFFDAARIMKKDDIYPIGAVKKQIFLLCVAYFEQTYNKQVFDEEGNLLADEEDLAHMLEFYDRLLKEKVLLPANEFNKDRFKEGKVASAFTWTSDAESFCKPLEEAGGSPVIGGQVVDEDADITGYYIKPATFWGISKYTEHPEKAARVLDFLINSKEMAKRQLCEKGVPVSRSALEAVVLSTDADDEKYEFEANQYLIDHKNEMTTINPSLENEEVISAFKSIGDDYFYKKKSLNDAAMELKKEIVANL